MSGFVIYTKKRKFAWDIACMDIGVTFVALSAIFVALFSVFSTSYGISCVFFLQGIAIPLAIFVAWGRKYRIFRWIFLLLSAILSYWWFKVNALHGIVSIVNSAIRLINQCYKSDVSLITGYGIEQGRVSFFWVLCMLECLFAILFLKILKHGRGRFYGIFVFLLPVILGIFCGKVPDVFEGCFLILAIFFFLIASYQRERIPVKAMCCAAVLLAVVWLGASPIESSIYKYKTNHMDEYREIKLQLIEARSLNLSNWIPDTLKQMNFNNSSINNMFNINAGMGWNKNLKTLESVNQGGQVMDTVILEEEPTSPVYWPMFEGYVYTGNGWEEKDAEGVYDQLSLMQEYCDGIWVYDNDRIFETLKKYFDKEFKYSKNPGKMPEDMDFAEGFMFEKQEGFCVHFATATTIVYQMRNREARYVEGYLILPSDFKKQKDGSYKAIVTDYMAHAWCETYETRGWMVRELTPSAGLRTEEPTPTPTEQITPTPTKEPQVTTAPTTTNPKPNASGNPTQAPSEEKPTLPPIIPSDGQGAQADLAGFLLIIWTIISKVFLWMFGIAASIALVCVLVLFQQKIRMNQKNRSFRNKYAKKAILAIYRAVQELCIFEGLKDKELWRREQIGKVAEKFPQISSEEWLWIYDCAERTMFSNDVMQEKEQKQIYTLYQQLRKEILKSLKGTRRFWFLYGRVL